MALTRIRQSNITQPLDADLDTLSLSANGNITATGDLTVGGNTAITGALTAGSIGVSGDVNFGDGDKAIFNNNLEIYGDGVTSRIDEVSTGNLAFKASNLYLKSYGTNEDYITAIEDGAVSLFHGSSATAKLATTSTGVDITGDLLVSGDFTVSGNTTFINSDNLAIEDLNIVLANGAANSAVADGAGITIDGADATLVWDDTEKEMVFNKDLYVSATEILVNTSRARFAENNLKFTSSGAAYIDHATTGQVINFRVSNSSSLDTQALQITSAGNSVFAGKVYSSNGFYGVTSASGTLTLQSTSGNSNHSKITVGDIVGSDNGGITFYTAGSSVATQALRLDGTSQKANFAGSVDISGSLNVYGGAITSQSTLANTEWSDTYTGTPTSPTNTDALIVSNAENTSTYGQVGIWMSDSGSGGMTVGRLALKNDRSGAGRFVWQMRDSAHTTELRKKMELTSKGDLFVAGQADFGSLNNNHVIIKMGPGTEAVDKEMYLELYRGDLNSNRTKVGILRTGIPIPGTRGAELWSYQALGLVTNNSTAGHIVFKPRGTEAVRIEADGNVGIGTDTPVTSLHISKDSGNAEIEALRLSNGDDTFTNSETEQAVSLGFGIQSSEDGTRSERLAAKIVARKGGEGTNDWFTGGPSVNFNGQLDFYTRKDDVLTKHMTLNEDGVLQVDGRVKTTFLDFTNLTNASQSDALIYWSDGSGTSELVIDANSTSDSNIKFFTSEPAGSGRVAMYMQGDDWQDGGQSTTVYGRLKVADGSGASGAYENGQIRHSIRPTLNLDFANSKKLDRRVQFNRNSVATYYDEDGLIKRSNVNEPRFDYDPVTGDSKGLLIEGDSINYMNDSEHMANLNRTNISLIRNYGKSPTGEYNSVGVKEDIGTTSHYLWRNMSGVVVTATGKIATVSVYAKAAQRGGLQIRHANGNGSFSYTIVNFNLITGTVIGTPTTYQSENINYRIDDVGNGWYRCSVSCSMTDSAVTSRNLQFWTFDVDGGTHTQDGDGIVAMELFGAQFEHNAWASSYIPSDTRFDSRSSTATYWDETGSLRTSDKNSPRYGYAEPYQIEMFGVNDSGNYTRNLVIPPRVPHETNLILESSATNLQSYSYNMNQDTNGFGSATIATTTETKAPDSSYTASKVTFSGVNGRLDDNHGVFNDGEYYTLSVWVKGTAGHIVSSALLTNTGANIEPRYVLTGEWQKITVTKKYLASQGGTTVRTHCVIIRGEPGASATAIDGTTGVWASYVYVWGMQVELGKRGTSYIPTQGATVTRAADIRVSSNDNLRDTDYASMSDLSWYNQRESTIYGEATSITYNQDVLSNPCLWGITDGTSNNRYLLRRHDNDIATDAIRGGFTFRLQMDGGFNNDYFTSNVDMPDWDDDSIHKMALSIKENSQIAAADGLDAQMPSITAPQYDTCTMVQIGLAGSSAPWNGHIRKLSYYPTQLTLTQLQALTEID